LLGTLGFRCSLPSHATVLDSFSTPLRITAALATEGEKKSLPPIVRVVPRPLLLLGVMRNLLLPIGTDPDGSDCASAVDCMGMEATADDDKSSGSGVGSGSGPMFGDGRSNRDGVEEKVMVPIE